jgi:hypothetical protein
VTGSAVEERLDVGDGTVGRNVTQRRRDALRDRFLQQEWRLVRRSDDRDQNEALADRNDGSGAKAVGECGGERLTR